MKKAILVILMASCLQTFICAQSNNIDSLINSFEQAKNDSVKLALCRLIALQYSHPHPDSSIFFLQQGISLAKKNHNKIIQAHFTGIQGWIYSSIGDYPRSLELYLEDLQLAEQSGDNNEISNALDNFNDFYYRQNDERKSITYSMQAIKYAELANNARSIALAYTNAGDSYYELGMLDSALYYSNFAYQKSISKNINDALPDILANLGNIYYGLHNYTLALDYLRMAMSYALSIHDEENFSDAALKMATIFRDQQVQDSALHYASLSWKNALINNMTLHQLHAVNFLGSFYENKKITDSAFKYLKLTLALKDSLFSQEKSKNVQALTFRENIRQQEIAEQKKQAQEEFTRNLQRAGIAAFIPIFFLILLLLSRTKVKGRVIEFLAIVWLLLLFEFITDFLYPFVSTWTNESPLWETLIFVIVAALLEPLSYRIEHWVKKKLAHRELKAVIPATIDPAEITPQSS